MKRIISLALCLMMVLSLATVAFADDGHTLTIHNPIKNHEYEAYQIFSGTLETVAATGTQVLTGIQWGSSIDDPAALLADIQKAIDNADAESPLKKMVGITDAGTLAESMADNITSDSESLDILAVIFEKHIKAGSNIGTLDYTENFVTDESGKTVDRSYYTISGMTPGYYLVKDRDTSLDNENDSYTKFILRVIKDESVSPKSGVPSVEKQINDTIDGTYGEYEDFDTNDTVYYKWIGHLPSNLKEYETYFYKFTDTLPLGIAYMQIEQIYLEGHDGNTVHTFYNRASNGDTYPSGISVEQTKNAENTVVTMTFNDLMTLYPAILPTQKIIVKYSAYVTRDALTADSITNKVHVNFSNDPNWDGIGTEPTGQTPEDTAHAFTFRINVDKYDADNKENKLEGAEFRLYYERTENDALVKYYAKVVTEEMVFEVGADGKPTTTLKPEEDRMLNKVPLDANDIGVVYGWTTTEGEASILDTDATGALSIRGLDSGIFYLKETKAPAGYNLMETPVKIEIIPAYTTAANDVMVDVTYKVDDIQQESNTVGVRNSSGSTLPVTGGIGTTLFYILGSIMVVGAAVMMITKKRMAAEG